MKRNRMSSMLLAFLLLCGALVWAAPKANAEAGPIEMTITQDPETRLETDGVMPLLTFTLHNPGEAPYTLYNAHLLGGYDGLDRTLNEEITIAAGGTREFTLADVPVADNQLDTDVTYTLTWTEITEAAAQEPEPTETDEPKEPERIRTERSVEATVRIARFVPPKLTVSVAAEKELVAAGEPFRVTYTIANETKYDMTGLELSDPQVLAGTIPLPTEDLTAGASISIPVEYTMAETDMVFLPVVRFTALQRQSETEAEAAVVVGAVLTGVRIEVQQYPSDREGTSFAITVVNTGNRTLRSIQLYDEINTAIDNPFDLAANQQKVLAFHVPSAYAAGSIRTVRFHVTFVDSFDQPVTYTDTNTYDCVPYVSSDAVRLSLLATLTDAYYDDAGKLCGEIQLEIRNYSDVLISNAVLRELTLFGTVETYGELPRGETFKTVVYQLDNVPSLSFCVNASDPSGKTYSTETIALDLGQLPALAARTEEHTIIYNSNTYLKDLADRIYTGLKTAVGVVLILVLVSAILCLVLWFMEYRVRSGLRGMELLLAEVPTSAIPKPAERVLGGSPAEQLGYTAPAKMRYGAATRQEVQKREPYSAEAETTFAPIKQRVDAMHAHPTPPQGEPETEQSAYARPAFAEPVQAEPTRHSPWAPDTRPIPPIPVSEAGESIVAARGAMRDATEQAREKVASEPIAESAAPKLTEPKPVKAAAPVFAASAAGEPVAESERANLASASVEREEPTAKPAFDASEPAKDAKPVFAESAPAPIVNRALAATEDAPHKVPSFVSEPKESEPVLDASEPTEPASIAEPPSVATVPAKAAESAFREPKPKPPEQAGLPRVRVLEPVPLPKRRALHPHERIRIG